MHWPVKPDLTEAILAGEVSVSQVLDEITNGAHAYHVTHVAHLPEISKHGLQPQEHESAHGERVTFVEPDESEVAVYHTPPHTAMLRFPIPEHYRWATTDDGEYVHYDPVHPHHIEIKHKNQWVPLHSVVKPAQRSLDEVAKEQWTSARDWNRQGYGCTGPECQSPEHRQGDNDYSLHTCTGANPDSGNDYWSSHKHSSAVEVRPRRGKYGTCHWHRS